MTDLRTLVLLALVACSKGEQPTASGSGGVAPKPTPEMKNGTPKSQMKHGTPIPKDHPKTFLVSKHCHRSPHPPDRYFSSDMATYDLEAGTWTRTTVQGNEPDNPPRPDEQAPEPTKTDGKLDSVRLQAIKTSVDKVLANGPYEQKYPYSGGGRCTLNFHVGADQPFFSVDRADNSIKDEVERLMSIL